jgi:hypothetical protein
VSERAVTPLDCWSDGCSTQGCVSGVYAPATLGVPALLTDLWVMSGREGPGGSRRSGVWLAQAPTGTSEEPENWTDQQRTSAQPRPRTTQRHYRYVDRLPPGSSHGSRLRACLMWLPERASCSRSTRQRGSGKRRSGWPYVRIESSVCGSRTVRHRSFDDPPASAQLLTGLHALCGRSGR